MYQGLLGEVEFYRLLLRLDEEMAAATRALGCWRCGKVLHVADFTRKPRGVPPGLGEGYCERLSFCCADRQCRRRRTPPSLRFLGRKVYLAAVVTIITAMRCGMTPARIQRLKDLVGVSRQTVLRWQAWWQQVLPETTFWRAACGAFSLPVMIGEFPLSALERFTGKAEDRVLGLLRLLAPLTGGKRSTQSM
jgi:hypothetical protein